MSYDRERFSRTKVSAGQSFDRWADITKVVQQVCCGMATPPFPATAGVVGVPTRNGRCTSDVPLGVRFLPDGPSISQRVV